ncbi:peptide ABC transporter permease, partial [Mesotoga sp. SC_3PWM13N19]
MILTVLLVSLIAFVAFEVIPGNPALSRLGVDAEESQFEALSAELGLNDPLGERLSRWFKGLLTGDLGTSMRYSVPVSDLILDRIPVTLSLALMAMMFITLIGIPLGIVSAKYGHRLPGILISMISQIGMAIPSFWSGIILMYIFGIVLRWVSPGGYVPWSEDAVGAFKSLLLPAIAISLPSIASIIRYTRNSVMDQLKSDYVQLALSKGLNINSVL